MNVEVLIQQYLRKHDINFYFSDALSSYELIRQENNIDINQFLLEYFGRHVLYRDYIFIQHNSFNRKCFLLLFATIYHRFGIENGKLSIEDFETLFFLISNDFDKELVQLCFKIANIENEETVSFIDLLYTFQLFFVYKEFILDIIEQSSYSFEYSNVLDGLFWKERLSKTFDHFAQMNQLQKPLYPSYDICYEATIQKETENNSLTNLLFIRKLIELMKKEKGHQSKIFCEPSLQDRSPINSFLPTSDSIIDLTNNSSISIPEAKRKEIDDELKKIHNKITTQKNVKLNKEKTKRKSKQHDIDEEEDDDDDEDDEEDDDDYDDDDDDEDEIENK
ncbi:hypothetical protein SNEBB_005221 [Seison nebaliae]|nr:hypothetical protein SNEBB_005221 [Seison nebaliae]